MPTDRAKPRIMNQSSWLLGGWPKRAEPDDMLPGRDGAFQGMGKEDALARINRKRGLRREREEKKGMGRSNEELFEST